MSGYRPRHVATDTPPAGTPAAPPPLAPPAGPSSGRAQGEQPRRRGSGSFGVAAGAIVVLAGAALLLILSLPKSKPAAVSRATSTSAAPGTARAKPPRTSGSSAASTHRGSLHTSAAQAIGTKPARQTTTRPLTKAAQSTTGSTSPEVTTSPAENLPVPAGFGPLLRRVWVSAEPGRAGVTAADVQSTLPGSVYYAEQPAIAYYWAISQFLPSASAEALGSTTAGKAVLAQFSNIAVFYKAPGGRWQYAGAYRPGTCSSLVPPPVYKVWGFCLSSQVGS
jgi:hypothetical protein